MTPQFDIEPIGPTIGAEIHGLDLSQKIDRVTADALETALVKHKVIYARDQHISTAQQVAFGRLFGELEVHPFRPEGDFPEIMVLDNHKDNPVLSTDVWHSDTTFRDRPTKYSILRCLEIPGAGGDTLWADMCAAYDGLSVVLKGMINGLDAVHDFKNFRALFGDSDEDRERLREMEKLYPNPTHPVVRSHPVTGNKALFVNPQFTLRINGLQTTESDSLLQLLYEQAHVPEYQFRLRWKPGTIVLWDNPSTQHYAANDYYPNRRHMERVAVVGDKPY
ncbi:TauD/TfdA family dioxygenase [Alphaproteobacteria bacterium]|nr:TauD/TfdA family dioxygenase [Alphaproteobacteria bacterium]